MSNRRKLLLGAVALVAATFLLTAGLFLYLLDLQTGDIPDTIQFFRAFHIIKTRYVEDVPSHTLLTGAIKGMVDSLDDPHSVYMDSKTFQEFLIETEGSFGGVGIVIGVKDKVLTVVAPIEGTPGEQAGIKSGDQILKIDGQDTKDMPQDVAVGKIRGPEGTTVTLTIRRGETVRDYILTRSNIQIKTVTGKMLPHGIGYIRISMFNENTGSDFNRVYAELEKQGMKGLVLDLRDNPGGLLDESVKVAQKLVPQGPVVSVVSRDGHQEVHTSTLPAVKYPLAVLVNGGSASAAEIVAGAVQDTHAGTLVGTKTYGKGSVQTLLKLDGNTAIKLTIAKYLTPSGRSINGVGIQPDVVVQNQETPAQDVQLERAVSIVQSKL